MREAVILAGGLGTRLAKTVKDRQKVTAPVGGRPFLEYILEYLEKNGFEKVVLAVSFHSDQIRELFGESFGTMPIVYSYEKEPLGTGGAVKQALRFCEAAAVTVVNGDTFFDVDFDRLYALYEDKNADIVLAAKFLPDCTRHSTLNIADDGKILSFKEKKPQLEGFINGGVYIVNKDIFLSFEKEKFSFETDVLENKKDGFYALKSNGFFIDMGVPEAYFRANTEIPLLFGRNRFKAAFLDRDGCICKEKHHLYKTEEFEFISRVPEALERLREKGFLLFVITNQAGVAKGLYTEEDINVLHSHMLKLLEDITHIDGIYYCPYHEAATVEKYRKKSPDRKPSDGMIKKAVADCKKRGIVLDLEKSVLFGDKLTDIMCGKNAGVGKNILLRSGHKIDENSTLPDAVFDSLWEAVDGLEEI